MKSPQRIPYMPGSRLQLFAGKIIKHQATVAEVQFQHAAFAAEFVFPNGIEPESHIIAVLIDGLGVELAILHKDLIDDEIGVFGMLVLSAEAFPF